MSAPFTAHNLLAEGFNPIEPVADHPLFHSGLFYFTDHMFMMCLAALLMLIIFPLLTRPYRDGKLVPTGTRNFFEAMLVFFRETVVRPILHDDTDRYISYIWTLFFFILFTNLLGLLPLEAITEPLFKPLGWKPIGGAATGDIYVTGTLAAISFVVIQVSGVRANGLKRYLAHFTAGAPLYLAPLMIPIEILGIFTKPFALAIRLFANMIAGHIMLAVLISFVSLSIAALGAFAGGAIGIVIVVSSVAIMCLELFVAFLHAYIFAFLTTLFIGLVVTHSHEDEDHGHREHDTIDHSLPDSLRQQATHMAG